MPDGRINARSRVSRQTTLDMEKEWSWSKKYRNNRDPLRILMDAENQAEREYEIARNVARTTRTNGNQNMTLAAYISVRSKELILSYTQSTTHDNDHNANTNHSKITRSYR